MLFSSTKITLLLAIGAAAIPFDGPSETIAAVDVLGRSPIPTSLPQSPDQIFRRQSDDDGICGYISGIKSLSVSCTEGMCMYNAALNWFGCCTGTARSDCAISTSCVAAASINSCIDDPDCANNPFVTACTDSDRPYCATMSSVADEGTITHLVCAPSATKVQLLPLSASTASARNATATALDNSSSEESSSSSSSRRTTSSSSSSPLSLSVSRAGVTSTGAPASASQSAAPTSSRAMAAGSVKAAQALVGAGGLVGLVAFFF